VLNLALLPLTLLARAEGGVGSCVRPCRSWHVLQDTKPSSNDAAPASLRKTNIYSATHLPAMASNPSSRNPEQSACPVDHNTRAAWLEHARKQTNASAVTPSALTRSGDSCDSSKICHYLPPSHPSITATKGTRLGVVRETSSIPRADVTASPSGRPANNEQESGASPSGNWIYPSEEMFFNAMRRKHYDPQAEDMRTIVPIHNAVNERAWKEIKEWEQGRGAERSVVI
jgi:cytochrome c heme-lyase